MRSVIVSVLVLGHFLSGLPAARAIDLCVGDIVVSDWNLDAIFRIDPTTGDRTVLSAGDRAFTCHAAGAPHPCCTGFFTGIGCDPGVGIGPKFQGPLGIAFDSNGDILLVDRNVVQIFRIDPATGDREIVSGQNMVGACRDAGVPWDCCTGKDLGDGTPPCISTGFSTARLRFSSPFDITVESNGDLLVVDINHGIMRIDPITGDLGLVSACGRHACHFPVGSGPPFNRPKSIALEESGSIVVIDGELFPELFLLDGAVVRVDPFSGDRTILSGHFSGSIVNGSGPNFRGPWGLALGPSGDMFVSDFDLDALFRVDPSTGDRTIFSGKDMTSVCTSKYWPFVCCTGLGTGDGTPPCAAVGEGPPFTFDFSGAMAMESDGSILVADFDGPDFDFVGRVLRVDPVTGDRMIVSSRNVGAGPDLHTPLGIAVVPQEVDSDNDCVTAGRDHCPDTPSGEVADSEGCSIAQLVPCEGPGEGGVWKNHGGYVSSVTKMARRFREDGFISEKVRRRVVKEAGRSGCGRN